MVVTHRNGHLCST
uniref:Uncharacterized protein n=1 Tax=Arundo donax TaxID=35708 RepID=A0A0A9ENG6_ARUDO